MKSKEALDDLKQWVEYITRLDYVEPEVRNEVKKLLYDAYHKTTPEFKIIEQDLEVLEILKKYYKSDGWSNGGVIEFWKMTESQLNKINKWLNNE